MVLSTERMANWWTTDTENVEYFVHNSTFNELQERHQLTNSLQKIVEAWVLA